MDEKDVWRSAKQLIEQYGADALTHAAMKADAMIERGDVVGCAAWKRILGAIAQLQDAGQGTRH